MDESNKANQLFLKSELKPIGDGLESFTSS
jgi:hypothetical protein